VRKSSYSCNKTNSKSFDITGVTVIGRYISVMIMLPWMPKHGTKQQTHMHNKIITSENHVLTSYAVMASWFTQLPIINAVTKFNTPSETKVVQCLSVGIRLGVKHLYLLDRSSLVVGQQQPSQPSFGSLCLHYSVSAECRHEPGLLFPPGTLLWPSLN